MSTSTFDSNELWPGDHAGALSDTPNCEARDRIYSVSREDVRRFEAGELAVADLRGWPAQLGAPVIDGDGDPTNYDLEAGDRPDIIGERALWWVMNDVGGPHELSQSLPTNAEIQITAYTDATQELGLDAAILFRIRLVNRGETSLEDVYLGLSGQSSGWYVGSDSLRGLGYAYYPDVRRRQDVHGNVTSASGFTLLESDAGPRFSAVSAVRSFPASSPQAPAEFYNLLRARTLDGTPTRPYDLAGRPGEPTSALDLDGNENDGIQRRMLGTVGGFDLEPEESTEIVLAIVSAQGIDHLDSVARLRESTDLIRAAWMSGWAAPEVSAPMGIPELIAPADGVVQQPTTTRFAWNESDVVRHQLQVSTSLTFDRVVLDTVSTWAVSLRRPLPASETLYWRVRGINDVGTGPWSDTFSFSTGSEGRPVKGPLLLSNGDFAFVQTEAPGGVDPCGPDAISTAGCDDVGGNGVYRSLDATGQWFVGNKNVGSEATLAAYSPRAYELRFTERGSVAFYPFTSGRGVRVPIEAWDIGAVQPFEANDPSDDTQMAVALLADNENNLPEDEAECTFGYTSITEDASGTGFLGTQRIYAYYLTGTYDGYEALAQPELDANGGCVPQLNPEAFDQVDFGRGRPLQRVVFYGDPSQPNYRTEGPLPGHTVRFYSAPQVKPPLAAPADESASMTNSVRLFWYGGSLLQVAPDLSFESPLIDESNAKPPYLLSGLPDGVYRWRAGTASLTDTTWSDPWTFFVIAGLNSESEAGLPDTFTLSTNYPNPFALTTTLPYGLPEAGEVTATVFDLLGRRVATLVKRERRSAGWHELRIDGEDWPSGVYFIELTAGDQRVSRRLVKVN